MVHLESTIGEASQLQNQTFLALQKVKEGRFDPLSEKKSINPFCNDIRHFRTVFKVSDSEAMMDFGIWILSRCEEQKEMCQKINQLLGLFYELMYFETKCKELLTIVVEENFEALFISMQFDKPMHHYVVIESLQQVLTSNCVVLEQNLHIRLLMQDDRENNKGCPVLFVPSVSIKTSPSLHTIPSNEKELLRRSFVHKNSAREYVQDLGGDVLEEVRDLASADEEWKQYLAIMDNDPNAENLKKFVEGVLGMYSATLNNLFEFTALGYSLTSLGEFLKTHADVVMSDPLKRGRLIMFLENLGDDLASWRNHIFIVQDTGDIHYLDSSFFSSCMQIEGIMRDQEVAVDDENDIEFF